MSRWKIDVWALASSAIHHQRANTSVHPLRKHVDLYLCSCSAFVFSSYVQQLHWHNVIMTNTHWFFQSRTDWGRLPQHRRAQQWRSSGCLVEGCSGLFWWCSPTPFPENKPYFLLSIPSAQLATLPFYEMRNKWTQTWPDSSPCSAPPAETEHTSDDDSTINHQSIFNCWQAPWGI